MNIIVTSKGAMNLKEIGNYMGGFGETKGKGEVS